MKNIKISAVKIITVCLFIAWAVVSVAAMNMGVSAGVTKEYIPFDVKVRKSNFIKSGWTIWLEEGRKGYSHSVSKNLNLGDKTIYSKAIFKTGIIKKPKNGFMIQGISKNNHPITVPQTTYVHYVHDVEATAYDPSPESNGLKWAGITALGWRTRYGIAAVDPKVISLRSLIYVDGYGFAWCGDTGGAIKGKKIDLCYNTTEEAFRWGRKKVKVYVLGTKPQSFYANKKKK
ncbi:MAG: hypothetical protein CVV21_09240 [Candidatus Goldiibacteriota bacterium HGW-Goldbacteria-1]|jgi:3D (Asp-Asp-Asp) domain-containing protein|nr:MAG: hypothetical protein CVV21_09240 [Candidatus Goldiibacteriota bacterium HGW-Goldbacteria-1]